MPRGGPSSRHSTSSGGEPADATNEFLTRQNQILQKELDKAKRTVVAAESANEKQTQKAQEFRDKVASKYGNNWESSLRDEGRAENTTWQKDIDNGGDTEEARRNAWQKSCNMGNMSQVVFHPEIRFKAAQRQYAREAPTAIPAVPFPFMTLPDEVKAMIFKLWLKKEGPVHCLSRMCQYGQVSYARHISDNYPRRFHWGGKPCAIKTAHRANDVLKILLVSKDFCHIGIFAFYSLNMFTFSSLGEMERFIVGIGLARRERIQSVNLCFIGARMARKKDPKNATKQFASTRTKAFHALPQLKMLRRIIIYIDEGYTRMRRSFEEPEVKNILITATRGQENARGRRCLRTVQGLDYWTQFRGIKRLIIRDCSNKVDQKAPIRDQFFYQDFFNQVSQEKRDEDIEACQPINLHSPFNDWYLSPRTARVVEYMIWPKRSREKYGRSYQSTRDSSSIQGSTGTAARRRFLHGRKHSNMVNARASYTAGRALGRGPSLIDLTEDDSTDVKSEVKTERSISEIVDLSGNHDEEDDSSGPDMSMEPSDSGSNSMFVEPYTTDPALTSVENNSQSLFIKIKDEEEDIFLLPEAPSTTRTSMEL